MKIWRVIGAAVVICLGVLVLPEAESAEPLQAARGRSLAIPITVAAPRTVECLVSAGPAVSASAVALSADGKKLAVAGYKEVLLWDLENATLSKRLGAAF